MKGEEGFKDIYFMPMKTLINNCRKVKIKD